MSILKVFSLMILCFCLSATRAQAADTVKADSLKYLQELRMENAKRLKDVDETLRKRVEAGNADLAKDVSELKAKQKEHRMRQDFLDRLIFQVDAHFTGGDLRAFLEPALKEMAKIDAVSSDSGLYVFMRYAAEAVKRLPEQKENILSFLEGYMNRSVSNPIPPKEFLATRNYTNGAESESGSPLSRDVVGDVADRRLQEISEGGASHAAASAPAVEQKRTQ